MTSQQQLIVPAGVRRQRVDKVLCDLLPDQSRATLQRWIHEGRVLVDGLPCKPKDSVSAGMTISVEPGPPLPSRAEPDASVEFEILFEDSELVVVNKPAGLVVHPGRGHPDGTLINGLLARPGFGRPPSDELDPEGPLRPGIVHRIDKDTSGVMVVAKTASARESLKGQFAAHSIERAYLALTDGVPQEERIQSQHARHRSQRMKFTSLTEQGKPAVTNVGVAARLAHGSALVRCTLETGRTHQIRVHLAERSRTPILCDALYGRAPSDPQLRVVCDALGRQALHAAVLAFTHPATGVRQRFEVALPDDMAAALAALSS